MRQSPLRLAAALLIGIGTAAVAATPQAASNAEIAGQSLAAAISAPSRTPANVLRDRYRHPAETLSFFGLKPGANVVEMWPGGGWYTEILAPYAAAGGGTYYAVAPDQGLNGVRKMMAANPALYGAAKLGVFTPGAEQPPIPAGSADLVLTFRNVHNWMMGDSPFAENAFRQMYAMLKPGGVLGVVDHRLPESADSARESSSGYLKVSTVRRLAEQAGFRLVDSSEVNANPKDTADWSNGVWTLPPSLSQGQADREKYLAIGESDRMTLKFVKPAG